MWWPNYGSFEVLVGAVLTQNSQWTRVEVSLKNLRQENVLSIEGLAPIDTERLESLITPSGLFKSKAKYLKSLALALQESFGDFGTFCREADREWLLKQKGVGPETADSILCYACKRGVMVVDSYTARLLHAFGYSFDSYDALQEWCTKGLTSHFDEDELPRVYALFHGMIVEYVKANSKAKVVTISDLIIKDTQ
jgi:endonuclease-3 related protein